MCGRDGVVGWGGEVGGGAKRTPEFFQERAPVRFSLFHVKARRMNLEIGRGRGGKDVALSGGCGEKKTVTNAKSV